MLNKYLNNKSSLKTSQTSVWVLQASPERILYLKVKVNLKIVGFVTLPNLKVVY